MIKTGKEIEGDILGLLRSSYIITGKDGISGIRGEVYRGGLRPRDSKKEDLIVIFTTANAAQFQEGVVTLNIYVPYIRNGRNGVMVENGQRCEQIERLAQDSVEWLKADKSDYLFSLQRAIHTQQDDAIEQSYIVVAVHFKQF